LTAPTNSPSNARLRAAKAAQAISASISVMTLAPYAP